MHLLMRSSCGMHDWCGNVCVHIWLMCSFIHCHMTEENWCHFIRNIMYIYIIWKLNAANCTPYGLTWTCFCVTVVFSQVQTFQVNSTVTHALWQSEEKSVLGPGLADFWSRLSGCVSGLQIGLEPLWLLADSLGPPMIYIKQVWHLRFKIGILSELNHTSQWARPQLISQKGASNVVG